MASLSLVFDILARDRASSTFRDVGNSAERAGKQGEGFGRSLRSGMGIAAGVVAAAGIGTMFTGFISDARESAKIGRLTTQVIKTTGGVAGVTASQVEQLANAISNKTAVDDEAIQSASNLLLTFTKVRNETGKGNDIFNRATQAAVDMSVALGTDANGAALQLGKALNDPIKGVTALSRAGVSFTQQQRDQIRAMVEAGDTLGAQKLILAEMQTQFGGAAAAAADPLQRLKVVAGNLGEEVAGALLPVIEKFAGFLVDTLLPGVMKLGGWLRDKLGPIFGVVRDVIKQTYDILFRGDFTGGPLSEDSWVTDVLFRIREGFFVVRDIAKQVFDILFRGDFTGGPLSEDSFIVDALFRIREGAQWLAEMFMTRVLPAVRSAFGWLRENALPILHRVGDFLYQTFNPLWEALVDFWQDNLFPALQRMAPGFEMIAKVVGVLAVALGFLVAKFIEHVLPILVKVAGFLVDVLSVAFAKMASTIKWTYDNIIVPVFNAFSSLIRTVKDGFSAAVDGIGKLWDSLKEKLRGPVKWVVDVVWNNGLRALWNTANNLWGGNDIAAFQFARGGVMPGHTPGRDVHRFISPTGGILDLSGGEAVMRPEFTRVLGVPTINHLNEIARQEGERGLMRALGSGAIGGREAQHFAGGGIINLPGWLTTALNFLPGGGSLSAIANRVNGSTASAGGGLWGSLLLGMAKTLGAKVLEKAESLFGSIAPANSGMPGAPVGGGSLGGSWQSLAATIKAIIPQARVNSAFRPGDPGYHGRGKAVDFGYGTGPGGAGSYGLAQIKRVLHDQFGGSLAELIYNGIGNDRSNLKNSRPLAYSAATQAQHRNHVHAAVYDGGGLLPPGLTMAYNGTGEFERVLTAEQARARGGTTIVVDASNRDHAGIARALAEQQRDRDFLHGRG